MKPSTRVDSGSLVVLAAMISTLLIVVTSLLGPEERFGFLGLPGVIGIALLHLSRSDGNPCRPAPALLGIAGVTLAALAWNVW